MRTCGRPAGISPWGIRPRRDAFARRQLRARRRLTQLLAFYRAHPCRMARTQLLAACAITLGRFCGYSRAFDAIGQALMPVDDEGRPRTAAWAGYAEACAAGRPWAVREERWLSAYMQDLHEVCAAGLDAEFYAEADAHADRPDLAAAPQAHGGDRRGAGDRFLGPGRRGGLRDRDGPDHGPGREPALHGRVVAPGLLRGGGGPGAPHPRARAAPAPGRLPTVCAGAAPVHGDRVDGLGSVPPRHPPAGPGLRGLRRGVAAAGPRPRGARRARSTRWSSASTRTRPPST